MGRHIDPNSPDVDRVLDQIEQLIDEAKMLGAHPMRLQLALQRWRYQIKD